MSHMSGLSIKIHGYKGTYVALLKLMLQNGWSLGQKGGNMGYAVLTEEGQISPCDWESQSLSVPEPFAVLEREELANKPFDVALTYERDGDSHILSMDPREQTLGLSLGPSRRELVGALPFTDTSWYTEHLVGLLTCHNIVVESVQWYDCL